MSTLETPRDKALPDRELLTLAEVLEGLPVSRSTIWRMLHDGRLVGFRIGGRTLISASSVRLLLERGLDHYQGADSDEG